MRDQMHKVLLWATTRINLQEAVPKTVLALVSIRLPIQLSPALRSACLAVSRRCRPRASPVLSCRSPTPWPEPGHPAWFLRRPSVHQMMRGPSTPPSLSVKAFLHSRSLGRPGSPSRRDSAAARPNHLSLELPGPCLHCRRSEPCTLLQWPAQRAQQPRGLQG